MHSDDELTEYWDEQRRHDRFYLSSFPMPTAGQLLYERWCGSQRSDRARYWPNMNPAEQQAWQDLATDFQENDPHVFERVVRNIPEKR